MANMLGPAGYGILGLTLPFQGFLTLIAAGGLPPAIAKYVAQYSAKNDGYMVKQVIITSTKFMVVLGIIFSIIMYLVAKPLALGVFHKPAAVLPFQIIALITPFSVIAGAFRGVFQGFYKMGCIVITKAVEQVFMITFAVILVIVGLYVTGAVVGMVIGFIASAASAVILFRRYIWKRFADLKIIFCFREELAIAKMLLIFSFPVIITGLAELALYDIGTFVIGAYMASEYVGYYNAASPIARLPLIISMSVATAVLPATSEAFSLKNKNLLENYVIQSYRYVTLLVFPLCIGTMIFSKTIIGLLFGSDYIFASDALKILVAGMFFFTIYTVSSSISQGLGKPYLPMIILVVGTVVDLILSILLVPLYGINGAATATAIASLLIMIAIVWKTLQISNVKLPFSDFAKIFLASFLMGAFLAILPKTYTYLVVALLSAPILYIFLLALIGGLKKSDIQIMYKFGNKFGPFSKIFMKIIELLEKKV